jgi:hypothetical protein
LVLHKVDKPLAKSKMEKTQANTVREEKSSITTGTKDPQDHKRIFCKLTFQEIRKSRRNE